MPWVGTKDEQAELINALLRGRWGGGCSVDALGDLTWLSPLLQLEHKKGFGHPERAQMEPMHHATICSR